jgi:hypothetical protein
MGAVEHLVHYGDQSRLTHRAFAGLASARRR